MEKDKEKICPLLSTDNLNIPFITCKGEACAWWSEKHQKCAVAVEPPKK